METAEKYVFVSDVMPVEEWLCQVYKVSAGGCNQGTSLFSTCVLAARELVFSIEDILVCPGTDTGTVVVIAQEAAFQNQKFLAKLDKLNLEIRVGSSLFKDHNLFVQALQYTITAKLSPLWNPVGRWLLAGKMFLHNQDLLMAVQLDVNLSNKIIEVIIKPDALKITLLRPSQLGVDKQSVLDFLQGDEHMILDERHFGHQRVKVLPNLTSATLVSITKKIPENSAFKNWAEMKRYWKNMYGYRLVQDENMVPLVYYNVRFFYNATLLTYPEWCVRFEDPLPVRRIDPKPCVVNFVQSTMHKIRKICGTPFRLSAQIQRIQNSISSAGDINISSQINSSAVKTGSAPFKGKGPVQGQSTSSLPGIVPGFQKPAVPFKKPVSSTELHVKPWHNDKRAPESNDSTGSAQPPVKKIKPVFTCSAARMNSSQPGQRSTARHSQKPDGAKPTFSRTSFSQHVSQMKPLNNTGKQNMPSFIRSDNNQKASSQQLKKTPVRMPANSIQPNLQVPVITSDLKFVSKVPRVLNKFNNSVPSFSNQHKLNVPSSSMTKKLMETGQDKQLDNLQTGQAKQLVNMQAGQVLDCEE